MHKNSSVLLIGGGRLAKHLSHWNNLLDRPNDFLHWNRSQNPNLLTELFQKSQIVWLAITDSAISSFVDSHPELSKKTVVHFSGSYSDHRLLCAHPLMSFPQEYLSDEVYPLIHFATCGFSNLTEALPGFHNHSFVLTPEAKAYYHALCVIAGNFPQLLWSEVSKEFEKMAIPEKALDLYIEQIARNYVHLKARALTGPLVRKDYSTIEKNISSLEKSPHLKNLYCSFAKELPI